ncbi:hypothetical protein P22_3536 [Propionispora sp. 2/2-37]|uniref:hypothetical protein n=1 Tax=Propionispora sp. 2/2-37 TaxID=1677858 RepID=UPI0006C4FA96|nr:hypothetical protein [Propionispora sp. 2/2-37]CUH97407.1 hypothetical protein P22_3536 [Propionispora sp. 2/2-37]
MILILAHDESGEVKFSYIAKNINEAKQSKAEIERQGEGKVRLFNLSEIVRGM